MALLRQPIPPMLQYGLDRVRSVSREEGKQGEGTGNRHRCALRSGGHKMGQQSLGHVPPKCQAGGRSSKRKRRGLCRTSGGVDTLEKLWLGV